MFEKYLEKLIKQKLGAFLEGVDENKLNFGMTEANLSLNNVKLKQDALIKLKMPISIELGEIKQLYIRVPWLKIGSAPVEVSIVGLNIIVSPQKKQNWVFEDIFSREYLEQSFMSILSKVESELNSDDQQGYFSKLAMKVLDNIQVSIRDIHFRFEDHFSTLEQSYSFGLVLKRLEIQTTNEQWTPMYVDRSERGSNQNLFKMVEIVGLGFYLNPDDKNIIYQQTSNKEMRIQLMEALIKEDKREVLQYLLRPMNLKLKVTQNTDKSQKSINVDFELEKLHVSFLRSQLRCLIKFMELVSEFQTLQAQQLKTKKFRFLRPIAHSVVKQNSHQWWQYAFQCIKMSNKAKNGSMREFKIPKKSLILYKNCFGQLLDNYCIKKEGTFMLMLPQGDVPLFKHVMSCVELLVIKNWVKEWIDQSTMRKQQQNKDKTKGSFTSWIFGGSQKEKRQQIMSDQEAEAIEKEIQSNVRDFDPSTMTIGMQVVLKQAIFDTGIQNESGLIEGIRLFSSDIQASFKQNKGQDLAFELSSSIRDFGVDLYSFNQNNCKYQIQDSIIISNKKINKFSSDQQWEIRVRKRPEENKLIEFDIELNVNPFLMVYQKEFIKRAILISKVNINQEAQNAAIDKIEDIREATSNSIYNLLYKKANRLRINIASPVIVLPLSADKNPTSPLWVLRLGDLKIQSVEEPQQRTSIIEYERYRIVLDNVRMKYYQTYDYWEKQVSRVYNLRELTIAKNEDKNDTVFSVLEDCSIKLDVAIKQKKGGGLLMMTSDQRMEYQKKPKLSIVGTSSDIKINLSHSLYNKLVNFDGIFDMSSIQEIQQPIEKELIETKQALIKKAQKVGQIQKRLDPLNQWENYFCILSDTHLYFYKDAKQIMPVTHFYFKGADLVENSPEISVPNNLLLKNRFGECCLAAKNDNDLKEWAAKIRIALYELKMQEDEARLAQSLNIIDESQIQIKEPQNKKKQKDINHEAVLASIQFNIPFFKTLLVDELRHYSDWIMFQFTSMHIKNIKKKTESELDLKIKEISLVDLTMPINSSLIGKKLLKFKSTQGTVEYDALNMKFRSLDKMNPEYLGVDSQVSINLTNLFIKMQPNSINEVLKFLRNTKPGISFNLMKKQDEEDNMEFDDMQNKSQQQSQQVKSEASFLEESGISIQQKQAINQHTNQVTCQTIREVKMQFNVTMTNVSLSFLHQDYNMEIFRLDSSLLEIDFITYYDHFVFAVRFKDAFIYDLTGYPYTINPREYAENPANFYQTQREMTSMKSSNNDDFALDLRFEGYEQNCVLKKKGIASKLKLKIKPLVVEFFNESFMRFLSYFFEQFMSALILTDPYNNPELEELERLKRRKTMRKDTIKKLVDFQQDTEIIDMDIVINDFAINIPERPGSKNCMSLNFGEFRVAQQIKLKPGRVQLNKEKALWAKSFRMEAEKVMIMYGGDTNLTDEPFNFQIMFETLANSPILAKLDPKIVDQSAYLRVKFDPVLLTIKQKIYTMILRIVDLNVAYTDFLEREYYFLKFVLMEEYFKSLEDIVGMRMKIEFKCLALRLEHVDDSFVSELMLLNFVLKMTKFRDLKNLMEVYIQHFFMLDQNQPRKIYKQNHNELLKLISPEDCVIQPKIIKPLFKKHENEFKSKQKLSHLDQQIQVVLRMKPNGEKDMKIDIRGLRISIKPHVLLMIQNFFLNSFPEYDQLAVDKPSTINFDPEKSPKMDIKVLTQECLLVFQNRPGLKILACHGDITFELRKENIKEIKKLLEKNLLERDQLDENAMDFDRLEAPAKRMRKRTNESHKEEDEMSEDNHPQIDRKQMMTEPSKATNDIAMYMLVKIDKFCPFVCSLNQLNEFKSFNKIKKRQLMRDFMFSYTNVGHIIKVPKYGGNLTDQLFEFGANMISDIHFSKMKAKISIQDMILMNQIVDFANHNIINEYQKKLDKINQLCQNHDTSRFTVMEPKQDFNPHSLIEDAPSRIIDDLQDEDEENILDSLNQQYQKNFTSEIQRLRSTTRALSSIAQKLTLVEKKVKIKDRQGRLIAQSASRATKREKSKVENVNSSVVVADEPQRHTQLSNAYQKEVFFSAQRAISQPQILERSNINDFVTAVQEHEEEFKRETEVFYSVKDHRETTTVEMMFHSPHDIIEEESSYNQKQREGVLTQQEKMRRAAQQETIKFENALENIISESQSIKSDGIQIIFINDYDDVFCPVIELDIPEAEMGSLTEKGMHEMRAVLPKMRLNYYNPKLGDQEPFIESFSVVYEYVESESALHSKQIFTNIDFPTPIWINLTDQCFENLIETYYSWLDTSAYQFDDFRNPSVKKKKQINPPQKVPLLQNQMGSLNENGGAQLLKNSGKDKSNTGSINEDHEDLDDILSENNKSIVERVLEASNINKGGIEDNNQNFNKVSPYSIRNLTGYNIRIGKSQRAVQGFVEQQDLDTFIIDKNDSFFVTGEDGFPRQSSNIFMIDFLEVPVNQTVQYTVDLDNEKYDLLNHQSKKITPRPLSNMYASPETQRERLSSMTSNRFNSPERIASIDLASTQALKKFNKNQELVNIMFDCFEDLRGIDLNKIDQSCVELVPKMGALELNGSLIAPGDISPIHKDRSTLNTVDDEVSSFRQQSSSKAGSTAKEKKKKAKGNGNVVSRNFEKVTIGVILKKMRKILTIRQQYVLSNQTLIDYIIKISHNDDKSISKTYIIKSESQFGLNSNYYKNHSIQFKVLKKPIDMPEDPLKIEEENKLLFQDDFSLPIPLDELIKLPLDNGRIVSHDQHLYSYLRKQNGEISKTFDILIVPPVSIKNCLPCGLEIMSTKGEGQGFVNFAEEEETKEGGSVYKFNKQDEKQLHIYSYLGSNKDEVFLRFRVSGYIWEIIKLKRKSLSNESEEDIEVKIRDKDLSSNSICVRLMQKKAGFQLIFYAQTVILNQSIFQLSFHQNTLNKQVVAGQHSRHDMCFFNATDSFVAGISSRYSSGLNIKNLGLTEYFSIQTDDTSISLTYDEENKNNRSQDKNLIRTSQLQEHEKRFEFVYQTYMSLVSDKESVYTKIVCISPRYVIVNKINKKKLLIAQTGNETLSESLDYGDRKEWYWQDSSNDFKVVLKFDDEEDINDPFYEKSIKKSPDTHRTVKWLWSSPIDISQPGIDSVALLQDTKRFNNKDAKQIIKINRKIIDGTTYVILEDEDMKHPQYRIENLTDDITVWFVQKDVPVRQEGVQLLPMQITPFAFHDLLHEKPELQLYVTKSQSPNLKDVDLQNNTVIVSFNKLDKERNKAFNSPEGDFTLKFTVLTDGCSRIVRISDKFSAEQEERALSHIKLNLLKASNQIDLENPTKELKPKAQQNDQVEQKSNVTNILKINVSEILVSFVAKITEREKHSEMKSMRKEIAILTIQDINFERMESSEQKIQNNKLKIMKIQIDNQSSVTPLFPTVLQPMMFKNKETQPMVDFELDLKVDNPELTYIENLDFKLSGIVVKLDDRFLGYFVTFVMELQEKTKTNFTGLHPIFKKSSNLTSADVRDLTLTQNKILIAEGTQVLQISRKETGHFFFTEPHDGVIDVHHENKQKKQAAAILQESNNRMSNRSSIRSASSTQTEDDQKGGSDENEQYKSWRNKKIDSMNKRIFIKDCKMSSVKIEISFLARKSVKSLGGKSQQSALNRLLDSWGLAVFNIDQVPIKVRPFIHQQIFGVQDTIVGMISDHFINNIKRNIVKLLFSFALFGNPRKLVSNVSKGLYDFKTMPMQGEGFGGFIKGTALGTVSLLKNTFEGAIGVAEAFSGGVSKLALVINQDEDYLGSREEKIITEKPRNLVEGVGFGCQTAVDSLVAAGLGVFTRPVIEARRNGFKGFCQGVYSGTTGLVLKPISGALDLISKSAEGIKNTVKIFEAQVFNDRRRLPRTFYGYQEQIKLYSDTDAYIQGRILWSIDNPIVFKNDHYIEAIPYKDNQRTMLLVLSEEHLILLDAAQKSVKWYVESKYISTIEKYRNGLIINLNQKSDGRIKVAIEITNTNVLQSIFDKLKHLQQSEE